MARIELETEHDTWAYRIGAFEVAYRAVVERSWHREPVVTEVIELAEFLVSGDK